MFNKHLFSKEKKKEKKETSIFAPKKTHFSSLKTYWLNIKAHGLLIN